MKLWQVFIVFYFSLSTSPQEAAFITTLYMMFSFQNATDGSDELCTVILQHKNTGVRFFLLTRARRSSPPERAKGRSSSLLKHCFTFSPTENQLIIMRVFLDDKTISNQIAFPSFFLGNLFYGEVQQCHRDRDST